MRVLFLLGFDSTNVVFVNLIEQLEKNGHECISVVKDKDDYVNTKMFIENNIELTEFRDFKADALEYVDFIFYSPFRNFCYNKLRKRINRLNIFTLSFANLFASISQKDDPDILLCVGQRKVEELQANCLKFNTVVTGNPQYDTLINSRLKNGAKPIDNIKKVLIIEQGAYPYGDIGKKQLADTFCNIAKNSPEIEFVVKPRYLPNEMGEQAHVITQHIYNYFDEVPKNLILMDTSTVLEEVIKEYDAAITTWSTAYLDAALLGIPLVFIEGVDSVDTHDVKKERVQDSYDVLRKSGCVYNFEFFKDNKVVFNHVSEDFLNHEVYGFLEPCSPKIVDMLEKIRHTIIKPRKKILDRLETNIDDFVRDLSKYHLVPSDTFFYTRRKGYYNELIRIIQGFNSENRGIGNYYNLDKLKEFWNFEITTKTTPEDYNEQIQLLNTTILEMKEKFIQTYDKENPKDKILQDYYFDKLFEMGYYDSIMNYKYPVICPESLVYNKSMVLFAKKKYKHAYNCYVEYYEMSMNKQVKDLKKDREMIITQKPFIKYYILNTLMRNKKYEIILELEKLNYYDPVVMSYYALKANNRLGNSEELKYAYNKFIEKTSEKKAKSNTFKNTLVKIKDSIYNTFYEITTKVTVFIFTGKTKRLAKKLMLNDNDSSQNN